MSQVSCPIFLPPLKRRLMLWALAPFQILPALAPVNCPGWGQAISFPLWSWNSLFQEVVICPVQVPGYPQIAPQRHSATLELDHQSSSPCLCPSSSLRFTSLLPESCSAFIAQQAPQAKGMSTPSPFHGPILFVALSNSPRTALSLFWGSCGLRRPLSTTLHRRNWNKMIPWGFSLVLVRCVYLATSNAFLMLPPGFLSLNTCHPSLNQWWENGLRPARHSWLFQFTSKTG